MAQCGNQLIRATVSGQYSFSHPLMLSRMGMRAFPASVSSYSTRGGISGYCPCHKAVGFEFAECFASIRGLMVPSGTRSSLNRGRSFPICQMMPASFIFPIID